MQNKEFKRHIAYEVLTILGTLALLLFVCRLWPILLLVILGIFIAAMRLLFLSTRKVENIPPLLPAARPEPTDQDIRDMAFGSMQRRITELVTADFPNARWVWKTPIRDMNGATWRDVVAAVLETCQSPVSLAYIYEQVEPYTKARKNQWWKEKVRQTLQCSPQLFVNTGRGMWALNRSA